MLSRYLEISIFRSTSCHVITYDAKGEIKEGYLTMKWIRAQSLQSDGSVRSSNIELLRIIAMLMIITYHIVYHTVNYQLTDSGSISRMANGLFNHPEIYKKLFIPYFIMTFGIVGNAVFILISGYFMVPKGKKIRIVTTTKKLLLQQLFAAVVLTVGSSALYFISRHGGEKYVGLQSVGTFNEMAWFAGYYFAIILTAYLFLNKFLETLDKEKYAAFLIIMFALCQFGWTGGTLESLAKNLRTYCTGLFLYAFGGFIHKYDLFGKLKTWVLIISLIIIYLFVGISDYNTAAVNIENYAVSGSQREFVQSSIGYFPNWSIVVISVAILLFELFRRMKIRRSRIINFFGSSTFMVYLIHDSEFVRSIWRNYDWITLLYYHPWLFILKLFKYVLLTFFVCVLLYILYLAVSKLFMKLKPLFCRQ